MAKDTKKKAGRKLGRGLGSLIGSPVAIDAGTEPSPSAPPPSPKDAPVSGSSPAPTADSQGESDLQQVPVASIKTNPRQPRQKFEDAALVQLAESIRSSGLMQPIVVRPKGSGFELVAGERRMRAFQQLKRDFIPAIVRGLDDREAAEWALIENLQREDLAPLERADGIARLMEEFSLTQSEAGKQLGLERATIANLLRLRDADADTRKALDEGLITQGHARALLGCTDVERRKVLLAKCVRAGWSVRETERQVQQLPGKPSKGSVPRSSHVDDLEERLGSHLGTKVRINLGRKKGTGKMSLEFYTLEQFEGLLDRLGFQNDQ
ncbi:MAG: ParB/RepB/Spo0J family partition protein [Phycisphaerales bacterium]|nr:ParB/RepB/Spo0J family partition protein [Phycisphaerales bacterium]